MSELQTVEDYIRTLEAKIDAWFHRHFGALAPDTEMHKAAASAHADLKTVVGITPPASVPAPTTTPEAASPAS